MASFCVNERTIIDEQKSNFNSRFKLELIKTYSHHFLSFILLQVPIMDKFVVRKSCRL